LQDDWMGTISPADWTTLLLKDAFRFSLWANDSSRMHLTSHSLIQSLCQLLLD